MNELDRMLDEFDCWWRRGGAPPMIGPFLDQAEIPADERTEALAELIAIDMEYRWRSASRAISARLAITASGNLHSAAPPGSPPSDRPLVEDYAERWPEILREDSIRLELIAEEFRIRHRWGDRPGTTEYVDRFGADLKLTEAIAAIDRELKEEVTSTQSRSSKSIDRTAQCFETPFDEVPPALRKQTRYRILGRLGRGGMGEVYLAEDTQLGRKVALKTPRFADDEVFRERFINEAKATAALHHESICPVFDVGEIDGQPFLTMAYIQGSTLREHWKQNLGQSLDQTLSIFVNIARAMQVAHDAGIVHRDLKPANVMIVGGSVPVVMDFGLARRQNAPDSERLTQAGDAFGSPGYMSPEQIEGSATDIRPASDIYSLGVMLFEALTGRLPFSGTVSSILVKTARDEPPSPSQWGQEIDPELEELCTQMLAKDPSKRPESMGEVAERLTAICDRLPNTNGDASTMPVLKRWWLGRYRAVWMSLGVCLAVLMLRVIPSVDFVRAIDRAAESSPAADNAHVASTVSSRNLNRHQVEPSPGWALRFDGVDDHVVTPIRYDGSHPLTFEAWVAPADPYGKGAILSNASDFGVYLHQDYDEKTRSRSWSVRILNSGRWVGTASHLNNFKHQRTHIAAVWNGAVLEVYVDGKRQTVGATPLTAMPVSDLPMLIGSKHPRASDSESSNVRFHGEIDEVRVSGIARYENEFEPAPRFRPDRHTLALYHFDEGRGDIAVDSSGRENHAQIVGATWVAAASMDEPSSYARQVEQFVEAISRPLPPPMGPALRFAHSNDCVTLPKLDFDFTQPFAMEVWMTPDRDYQTSDWKRVVAQVGPLSLNIQAYHNMYAFQTWLDGRGTNVNSVWPDTVHFDRRTHLVAQFDGSSMALFVNGRRSPGLLTYRNLSSTEAQETIRESLKNASGKPLILGRRIVGKSTLGGSIDRFRLSKGVRYTSDFEPDDFQSDERTIVLYDFQEGAGNVLHDRSGNGHDARIEGATWVLPTVSTE